MRRYICILAALMLGLVNSSAQEPANEKKLHLAYDVDFEMNFDNRELYRSDFSESMTIFGARLTPALGLEVVQNEKTSHRLMLGVDVMKDFGDGTDNKELFREMSMYYRLEKKFDKTELTMYAGIFPRSNMADRYSRAFFSDSLRFYDNNLEGLLLKFRRPQASFEVGCDWMGQYGESRRERFMVFSSGEGKVAPMLFFGYSGYMYHFANSEQVKGLVDNILINPYARLDLADRVDFQALSVTLGWLQAFQHNRRHVGHYVFPGGGHLDLEARKWDVSVRNMLFCGADMMPYYNHMDEGGNKYGSHLYYGDPFYRVFDKETTSRIGLYDRLEVCYEPVIWNRLYLRVAAVFHFNDFHYSGCQQVVGVKVSF